MKRVKIFGKSLAFVDGDCVLTSSPIANNSGTVVSLNSGSYIYNITGIHSSSSSKSLPPLSLDLPSPLCSPSSSFLLSSFPLPLYAFQFMTKRDIQATCYDLFFCIQLSILFSIFCLRLRTRLPRINFSNENCLG